MYSVPNSAKKLRNNSFLCPLNTLNGNTRDFEEHKEVAYHWYSLSLCHLVNGVVDVAAL